MAFVASSPALTNLLLLSSTAQSPASMLPGPLQPQPTVGREMTGVVFKIHNWDEHESMAINCTKILSRDPVTNDPKSDQVWISLNQSWRAAWR
jgi:hypothetical protein